MAVPARMATTQYVDADLTIHDVVEADTDMASQIMAGADEARLAAAGCEQLVTRLEALHAEIVELKVPGVLENLVLWLMELAGRVRAKALAVAENIPAASEAIAIAAQRAAARHMPLAQAVRDAGHVAPAEREYHDE